MRLEGGRTWSHACAVPHLFSEMFQSSELNLSYHNLCNGSLLVMHGVGNSLAKVATVLQYCK